MKLGQVNWSDTVQEKNSEEIWYKIGGDFGGKGGVSVYVKNWQFFIILSDFNKKCTIHGKNEYFLAKRLGKIWKILQKS